MTRRCAIAVVALLSFAVSLPAQQSEKDKTTDSAIDLHWAIWRDPGPTASLNLLYGAGGKGHAPDPRGTFTFLREDAQATSPKFDVTDGQGVEWKVKLGEEPQSETSASRLLWAAGYFVDEDYYMAQLTVTGLPTLQRGQEFVSPGGTIHAARLERRAKDVKKLGTWDWFDNPFNNTRELNGLRIMMALLNSWDLKEVNNSIYETGDERRYAVSDLGASFGRTGNEMHHSQGEPDAYAKSKFVDQATPDFVDFVMHSRPFFLSAVAVPYYRTRTRMEDIAKKIPRADAKWLGRRLSMLSDRQVRDGFRAGGFTPAEVTIYARAVRKRIAQLNAL